ncbi:MAG: DUF6788 family protein [Terracidiphilus sp.]
MRAGILQPSSHPADEDLSAGLWTFAILDSMSAARRDADARPPPEKQGPYYRVSFARKGKSSSKFVRKESLATIRRELKKYEVMKTRVDRWIDVATELSNLRLARKRT